MHKHCSPVRMGKHHVVLRDSTWGPEIYCMLTLTVALVTKSALAASLVSGDWKA